MKTKIEYKTLQGLETLALSRVKGIGKGVTLTKEELSALRELLNWMEL